MDVNNLDLEKLIIKHEDDQEVVIRMLTLNKCNPNEWSNLVKLYEPSLHTIVEDKVRRKDKIKEGGLLEKAARIHIGLEKLLVSRMVNFMFAIPVKRIYHYDEKNDKQKQIVNALERIYKHARINRVNIERGKMLYAACEFFTFWYVVKTKHSLYGFESEYKVKCMNYSPMKGVDLYPLFDEYGDLKAMTFKSTIKKEDHEVKIVDTYTANYHAKWKYDTSNDNGWVLETNEELLSINKIPGVYMLAPNPIYQDLDVFREEIEYKMSEGGDTIAYNSAPVIHVSGGIQGEEKKGESQRIIRTENGGSVSYVSWQQSIEAQKFHIETMHDLFFSMSQMADISAAKMMGLGNIGFDARKTIFTDPHLKVGEESGAWGETFEREFNVLKAILGQMNVEWQSEMDNIEAEHIITPFIQNEENTQIKNYMAANGGKPIISHLESIKLAGLSTNPESTLQAIQEDEAAANPLKNMFSEE